MSSSFQVWRLSPSSSSVSQALGRFAQHPGPSPGSYGLEEGPCRVIGVSPIAFPDQLVAVGDGSSPVGQTQSCMRLVPIVFSIVTKLHALRRANQLGRMHRSNDGSNRLEH